MSLSEIDLYSDAVEEKENEEVEEAATEELETDSEVEEVEEAETEEDEAEEDSAGDDDDVVYEIDGEEVSAKDLASWKESFAREQESDTAKTDYAKLSEELAQKSQKLDNSLAILDAAESEIKALLLADLETDEELKELESSDFQEYQRIKHQRDKRVAQIDAIKEKASKAIGEKVSEQSQALAQMRNWTTEEKRSTDLAILNDFAKEAGFSADDMKTLVSANVVNALIEAAAMKKKLAQPPKSRKKVVKVTKVKATPKTTKTKSTDPFDLYS